MYEQLDPKGRYENMLYAVKDFFKAFGNIGLVYHNESDFDNAIKYHEEAKQIFKQIGNRYFYSKSVGNLGFVYCKKGDYSNAVMCYEKAIDICREQGIKYM